MLLRVAGVKGHSADRSVEAACQIEFSQNNLHKYFQAYISKSIPLTFPEITFLFFFVMLENIIDVNILRGAKNAHKLSIETGPKPVSSEIHIFICESVRYEQILVPKSVVIFTTFIQSDE